MQVDLLWKFLASLGYPMIENVAAFFENLSPDCVENLDKLYAANIRFQDPVNTGEGLDDLKAIFEDLFKQLKELKMTTVSRQGDEKSGSMEWVMSYKFRGKSRELPGGSWFEFDQAGKIRAQRDYWDAGEGIYREFPGLGFVLGRIKKLVRVRPK